MARMIHKASSRTSHPHPSAAWGISPEARQHMIDEAAYYRYIQRGYAHGHEVEDWLAAEAQFDRTGRRQHPRGPETITELGMQGGSTLGPAEDEAMKRSLKAHSGREISRVESMEPEDAPRKE